MTHPDFLDALVHQRRASLRRSASRRRHRRRTLRERLGWLLVDWGLRLADARPTPPAASASAGR
ncbi:hypothetical protein [Prauserella sp. PE36]|uniref:hypothetical protein n=1 Tax=Prauserella sp. PE36 TaxID=1504709 RepID=UPI000DE54AFE|nr:hypothetical protein [Prauserella sp. PE36]